MSAYDPKRTLAVLHFRSAAQVSDDVLDVRRREGNAHELAGTAVAWPFTAHAQQAERMHRISFLVRLRESDEESSASFEARSWPRSYPTSAAMSVPTLL
jgi:hypothetical protein